MRKLKMDELGRKSLTQFKASEKNPVIIVLDNVRSMHNVGSIFRTADAFLTEAIFLCGYTPQPPHRDIQKTALGATESVDWMYFETLLEAVLNLKDAGYKIFAVEQADQSISLSNFQMDAKEKTAFIFGNEVEGVQDDVLPYCDGCIEIPQAGTKHSFNISVAAGIVMWKISEAFLNTSILQKNKNEF